MTTPQKPTEQPENLINTVAKLDPKAASTISNFTRKRPDVDSSQEQSDVFAAIDNAAVKLDKKQGKEEAEALNKKDDEVYMSMSIEEAVTDHFESGDAEKKQLEKILNDIDETNYYLTGYVEFFSRLTFERRLELLKISKEDAAIVCDSVILKGGYIKKLSIRTLEVELTTRTTEIYLKSLDRLSAATSRLKSIELLALYNCAGSLKRCGDRVFTDFKLVESEKRIDQLLERTEFLEGLPLNLYTILSNETVKFDLLVATVTSPEGFENL